MIPFLLYLLITIIGSDLPVLSIAIGGFIASLTFQFIANTRELYISHRGEKVEVEIIKCLKYWTLSFLLAVFLLYSFTVSANKLSYVLIGWYLIAGLYFILFRTFLKMFLTYVRSKGFNQRNVVIFGAGDVGTKVANNIYLSPEFGLKVIGFYDDRREGLVGTKQQNLEVVGNLDDLLSDIKLINIDIVYIALSMDHMPYIRKIAKELSDSTCSLVFVPDMFSFDLLNSRMGSLNGIPTISIYDTPMEGANRLVKRISDIMLSTLILILISPILLVISLAIKLTSKGPVLFKQNRYGIDGKAIKVWKFRSMTVMENSDTVVQATKGDVRITPLGGFLRKTSLDELPQFINVLTGGMSIVGPRPHAVSHNEEYRQLIGGYMLRHKVKPGITGWAQINGWRGETDTLDKMEKRIEFDLEYISNWTLIWDLKIIFLTIFKGFVNKNAY